MVLPANFTCIEIGNASTFVYDRCLLTPLTNLVTSFVMVDCSEISSSLCRHRSRLHR